MELVSGRIAVRVALAVALVVIAVFGIFGALMIHSQSRFLVSQVELNAYQLSETIKSSTKHAMMADRPEHVHEIIDEIGTQEGLEKVRIFNKEGRVIYSPDKSLIDTWVDKQAEACFGCHAAGAPLERLPMLQRTRIFEDPDCGRFLGIINPIYNEPECSTSGCHPAPEEQSVLGILDVTISLAEADEHLRRSLHFALLLVLAGILAIAVVIWLSLRYLVGRPVQRLLKATDAVAEGDLGYRLEVRRKDELGRLAASFNAMTENLQLAKDQLYRSDKLASLGRLAAGVAHEINNPLTGVLSFSSFLLKRSPEGSEEREDLETIVRETKRCGTIVKGLLDFSRQVSPRKTRACLNTAVRRAIDIARNQLAVNNISAELDLEPDLPELVADSGQMMQVLLNLVVNAADAIGSEGDGKIRISTAKISLNGEPGVEVRVEDNGPGIAPDLADSVFDPFFTTKGNAGTGLGLSVVWGIVDEHGGTIRFENNAGGGTIFILQFPIAGNEPLVKG